MGLIQALAYEVPEPNAAQRAMWHVSSSRPGAWLFAKSGPHLDRFLLRLSNGQVTLATLVAGIPVITIVTTGARTGQARTTPLLGVPFAGDLAVIGTRFGQKGTPGWYHNLRADPAVQIIYQGKSAAAVAARCMETSGRQSGSEPARSMAAMTHMPGGSRTGRSISCCSARKLCQPATPDRACQHAARYPHWQTWPRCLHGRAGQLAAHAYSTRRGRPPDAAHPTSCPVPGLLGDTA